MPRVWVPVLVLAATLTVVGVVWWRSGPTEPTDQAESGIRSPRFLGRWEAYSRNHRSISGDMVVASDRISFSRKGTVRYTVLSFDGREYVLKLSAVVDDGRIMRMGPIFTDHGRELMEVAYYEDATAARQPREKRHSGSVSWGVYER